MPELLIKNGLIVPMDGTPVYKGSTAIENGIITKAGENITGKAEKVIDASGCAVLPGLINTHTHLAMTLFRGFADEVPFQEWAAKISEVEARLKPSDVRKGAMLGILEMIRSGTTAFADMYVHMDEVARTVEKTGIRAALGWGIIESLGDPPDEKLKRRSLFVREWNGKGSGRIAAVYAPHSVPKCSPEFLIKIKEQARRDGARVHIHLLETEEELRFMKKEYGMCSVNKLEDMGFLDEDVVAVHCIWLSDHDIDILAKRKVKIAHCPASNMKLANGTAPVPEMIKRGITVSLGTDGCASNNNLDMFSEMKLAALQHKQKTGNAGVVPAPKALEMATVSGAKALGIKAGVLRAGYLADIILIDLKKAHLVPRHDLISNIVYSARGGDVKTMIVNGEILMEDYKVKVMDEDSVLNDAASAVKNLFQCS